MPSSNEAPVGPGGAKDAEREIVYTASPASPPDSESEEKWAGPEEAESESEEKLVSPEDSEHDEWGSPEDSDHNEINEENRGSPEESEADEVEFGFQVAPDDSHRTRVLYMLAEFERKRQCFVRKEEQRVKDAGSGIRRADLKASKSLMSSRKHVNGNVAVYGDVDGVEVGDQYNYRVELLLICLHSHLQAGIGCYINKDKFEGRSVAASVVISGGYKDDIDEGDTIIYTGQGQGKDQELKQGNLALYNSCNQKLHVRVIRGERRKHPFSGIRYSYDGLYDVTACYQGKSSKDSFMKWKYKLVRKAGQRPRGERIIFEDLAAGSHKPFKVHVVSSLHEDTVPNTFEYISNLRYSQGIPTPSPAAPCLCSGQECYRPQACECLVNSGDFYYNENRRLLWAQTLVYECSPLCPCTAKCANRVAQMGLQFVMEVFETKTKGWGVRCTSSILQGSFVCEYMGEIIHETDAEKLVCEDTYLLDLKIQESMEGRYGQSSGIAVGSNHEDHEDDANSQKYTVDANRYGNLSRFINHSCAPNLFVQCVLYDHHDHRFPHIMLFASKNILPYEELTFDYRYDIGSVRGPDGEVKDKECLCGAVTCRGRMY